MHPEYGLGDSEGKEYLPMDWVKFKQMPSARLFLMRGGDALFMPAGTFHYVYTVRTKLVVAGDYMTACGWRARVKSVERDECLGVKPEIEMPAIFRKGVLHVGKRLLSDDAAAAPAGGGVGDSGCGPSPAAAPLAAADAARERRSLESILQWAEALQKEAAEDDAASTSTPAPASSTATTAIGDPEVRRVLGAIWVRLHPSVSSAGNPWAPRDADGEALRPA